MAIKWLIYSIILISGIIGIAGMARMLRAQNEKMPPSFWAYVAWVVFIEIVASVLYLIIF